MIVVVYETCVCGAEVPRKVASGAIQTVWCGACGIEVRDCKAAGCDKKAVAYTGSFDRPLDLCRWHAELLEQHGDRPVTYRGRAASHRPSDEEGEVS